MLFPLSRGFFKTVLFSVDIGDLLEFIFLIDVLAMPMVVICCSSFSTVSNVKGFAFVVGCTASIMDIAVC